MKTEKLTARLQAALEHLKQAKELGSTLADYAVAFNLNVKDLYNGRTQLQRKGLWPKIRQASASKPRLLAVQVSAEPEPSMSTPEADWKFRITGPGGWVMECRQLPDASWLRSLSATPGKAIS